MKFSPLRSSNNCKTSNPTTAFKVLLSKSNTISWLKTLNAKYPEIYSEISEITLASGDEIILILEKNPTKIMLGNHNTFHKLEILKNFKNTLNNKKEITDYAYLDMRYNNQIIAKEL